MKTPHLETLTRAAELEFSRVKMMVIGGGEIRSRSGRERALLTFPLERRSK